jgi:hypothetical protein
VVASWRPRPAAPVPVTGLFLVVLIALTGLIGLIGHTSPAGRGRLGHVAAAPPTQSPTTDDFLYGVFEDANYAGTAADFAVTAADLRARHLNAILFTNNFTYRDEPLLGVADDFGLGVVFGPHAELNAGLWPARVPATVDQARRLIYPLVDHVRAHPSLLGYNVIDDAPDSLAPKIALAVQAFAERDPDRPAVPVLVEGQDEVARAVQTAVRLTYVYPALVARPPCDFSLGAGPDAVSDRLRHVAALTDGVAPLWVILQTHGSAVAYDPKTPDPTALREPTREEVRLQHWLAVGEGVRGIFWFAYSSQQFWTGLRDNPPLLDEVSDLARRTLPLRSLLAGLRKAPDGSSGVVVSAGADLAPPFRPYDGSLVDGDGRPYAVVVNHSCAPQRLTIDAPGAPGGLRDAETGTWYPAGVTLPFRGGDGRLFEVDRDGPAA